MENLATEERNFVMEMANAFHVLDQTRHCVLWLRILATIPLAPQAIRVCPFCKALAQEVCATPTVSAIQEIVSKTLIALDSTMAAS
jgi:hypothetical protein